MNVPRGHFHTINIYPEQSPVSCWTEGGGVWEWFVSLADMGLERWNLSPTDLLNDILSLKLEVRSEASEVKLFILTLSEVL